MATKAQWKLIRDIVTEEVAFSHWSRRRDAQRMASACNACLGTNYRVEEARQKDRRPRIVYVLVQKGTDNGNEA